MLVAEWVLGGIAVVGALLLVPLGLRLWHQVKAFGAMLGEASASFAEAAATLETAQAARTPGTDS
ncbi:MAG: hypothetical protein ABIM89_16000 [Mycobacteriales bacterium]